MTKQRKNPYAFKSAKMENQFQELRKRFKITRAEFETYYRDVRRANKKGQNLKRYGNALYRPKYSTSIGSIKNRKDFTARQKSIERVLSADFRKVKNAELRSRFYANLSFAYGSQADAIINMFMTFSDAQITQFLQQNKDIEIVYYESDVQEVAQYLNTIGMSAAAFINRANQ